MLDPKRPIRKADIARAPELTATNAASKLRKACAQGGVNPRGDGGEPLQFQDAGVVHGQTASEGQ